MRFSARIAASKGNRALIYEDAPRATRIGYLKGVLPHFVGSQSGYRPKSEPLDTHETHNAFVALIRDEASPWDYDNESSWNGLSEHLKGCPWPEFYDFVELVGKLLREKEDEIPFGVDRDFKQYQKKVNELFLEDGIGWSLNEGSELHRQVHATVAKRIQATKQLLTDKFQGARVHYHKAQSYLYQHPIDEANSIKEIVSAIESVARVIVPKASTLGEAIKSLKNDPRYSAHLIEALARIYSYSNATPLIRHGHTSTGTPKLNEAELVLLCGVGYIKYLIDTEIEQPPVVVTTTKRG